MSPASKETPNLNLPVAASEQLPAASAPGKESSPKKKSSEQAPAAPERASNAANAQPAAGLPLIPIPTTPIAAKDDSQNDVASTSQPTSKPLLDDTDLIEKDWVNKAKQIVERTRDDPHKQSEELTVFKADYMKQRYNKAIKVDK